MKVFRILLILPLLCLFCCAPLMAQNLQVNAGAPAALHGRISQSYKSRKNLTQGAFVQVLRARTIGKLNEMQNADLLKISGMRDAIQRQMLSPVLDSQNALKHEAGPQAPENPGRHTVGVQTGFSSSKTIDAK
ncbi:MAG: hypothetical protein K2X27_09555 [Candidatus Obscuribacterales bacterium]|nr:hypothetical protein [Candidatus Obscuribacterales bacterium]